MEVTFSGSGAINRAHYALVQKVESATDPGLADTAIIAEIDAIRARFTKMTFSSTSVTCKEWLLILLYCSTALTYQLPRPDYFEFALPAAVQLAEGGKTLSDRRVGYQYCVTIMPENHELNLMLVNTYRKDLDSFEEPQICLALNMLAQASTSDVIPAISSRLEELLSHRSIHVRRRVLAVFKALSRHDPALLDRTTHKIVKRLQDNTISEATLSTAVELVKAEYIGEAVIGESILDILNRSSSAKARPCPDRAVRALGLLIEAAPASANVPVYRDAILRTLRHSKSPKAILACFRALQFVSFDLLETAVRDLKKHPVSHIRPLLHSREPNDCYVFLACLLAMDARLWVGSLESIPPQLAEDDVHRIMSALESDDRTIRLMTIDLLHRVDPNILESYLARYIETIPDPAGHTLAMCEHFVSRALELSDILDLEGAPYARRLLALLRTVQQPHAGSSISPPKDSVVLDAAHQAKWGAGIKSVLESALELVLLRLRDASEEFRKAFDSAFVEEVLATSPRTPTEMAILAAITSEYGEGIVLSAEAVLLGLGGCLAEASPSVRELLLVAMISTATRCEVIPEKVIDAVAGIEASSGRHIRHRCNQFRKLAKNLDNLKETVARARSPSIPDVLAAVERYFASLPNATPGTSPSPSASSLPMSPRPTHKLRYDAYDPPQITAPRSRRLSNPRSASIVSDRSNHKRTFSPEQRPASPGFLALVGAEDDLQRSVTPKDPARLLSVESVATRMDLITLESPFHAEPPSRSPSIPASPVVHKEETFHQQFTKAWGSIGHTSRGWSESSPSAMAEALQNSGLGFITGYPEQDMFDQAHYTGEVLGLLVTSNGTVTAAIKLRVGDDDSCLWILKCDDAATRQLVRQVLQKDIN